MPISTNDEVWENGNESTRFHKQVLAFLRDHPSQAYRSRELADKLLGTSFHAVEERNRLRTELTDEEFTELRRSDEMPGGDDSSPLWQYIDLRYIERVLTRLEDEDFIEAREVTAEAFDLPPDETVIVYTYDGDADYEEF